MAMQNKGTQEIRRHARESARSKDKQAKKMADRGIGHYEGDLVSLDAKGAAATAGTLHVRVIELEASTF